MFCVDVRVCVLIIRCRDCYLFDRSLESVGVAFVF